MTKEIKRGDVFECWNCEAPGSYFLVTEVNDAQVTGIWNDGYLPGWVTRPVEFFEGMEIVEVWPEEKVQRDEHWMAHKKH